MSNATSDQEATGATLRAMRLLAGVSQTELAKVLGVSSGHLSHVEAGKRALTRDLLHKAATHIANVTKGEAAA